jgi:hypothetical protein
MGQTERVIGVRKVLEIRRETAIGGNHHGAIAFAFAGG